MEQIKYIPNRNRIIKVGFFMERSVIKNEDFTMYKLSLEFVRKIEVVWIIA